ncbi:MAG: hypothetical protein JXR10_01760 [Cyclobacteriaceae bacterium]
MTELKEIWGKLDQNGPIDKGIEESEIRKALSSDSLGFIAKLKRNVYQKLFITVVLTVGLILSIPFIFPLVSQILMSVLCAAYVLGSLLFYKEYSILKNGIDMSQDILHGLKDYYFRIKRVIHYEEIICLILYPISITSGFLFGMKLANPAIEVMSGPYDWVILIVSILVLTFLSDRFTKWLNRIAFESYLHDLKNHIEELED